MLSFANLAIEVGDVSFFLSTLGLVHPLFLLIYQLELLFLELKIILQGVEQDNILNFIISLECLQKTANFTFDSLLVG